MAQQPGRPVSTNAPVPGFALPPLEAAALVTLPPEIPAYDLAVSHNRTVIRIQVAKTAPLTRFLYAQAAIYSVFAMALTDIRAQFTGLGSLAGEVAMSGLDTGQMLVMAGTAITLSGISFLALRAAAQDGAQQRQRAGDAAADPALPPAERSLRTEAMIAAIQAESGQTVRDGPGRTT